MSKKHKKHSYHKSTSDAPLKTSIKNNWLTIILITAVLLIAIVGLICLIKGTSDANPSPAPTAPTVSIEENPAGNDVEDIQRYLKEKYNMEFTHEFTSAGASIFSAEGLPGLVSVFRREIMQSFDSSVSHLFTDAYADNGYMIVNMQKAATYYNERMSVDFGNHTILTYIDIIANPSKITVDTPYEQYLKEIANMSIPELIILTDKTLSQEDAALLDKEMTALGTPVAVRVFTMEAENQHLVTPSDIMQLGSGYKDVQYRKIFNADHLIG